MNLAIKTRERERNIPPRYFRVILLDISPFAWGANFRNIYREPLISILPLKRSLTNVLHSRILMWTAAVSSHAKGDRRSFRLRIKVCFPAARDRNSLIKAGFLWKNLQNRACVYTYMYIVNISNWASLEKSRGSIFFLSSSRLRAIIQEG